MGRASGVLLLFALTAAGSSRWVMPAVASVVAAVGTSCINRPIISGRNNSAVDLFAMSPSLTVVWELTPHGCRDKSGVRSMEGLDHYQYARACPRTVKKQLPFG